LISVPIFAAGQNLVGAETTYDKLAQMRFSAGIASYLKSFI
jgi:hypothetical protein